MVLGQGSPGLSGGNFPLIFGGGLTGLSAGYMISNSGLTCAVFEADAEAGGLCRTLVSGDYRYDIGGHRFYTKDAMIGEFVQKLMGDELINVDRTSKIFFNDKFFDYPLTPANAMLGLGPRLVFSIIFDYAMETIKSVLGYSSASCVSLEDWVVGKFGRTMFNIYFKEYSEKVWGIDCQKISSSWVSRRIQGLSLGKAVKNAFFKFSGRDIPTLADNFMYPRLGIGRLPQKLEEGVISARGSVFKGAALAGLKHDGGRITSAVLDVNGTHLDVVGSHYVSTIPLNTLVSNMDPAPPEQVREAAGALGFRDIVIVALAVDKENVTGESWVYIPEKKFPFGRIHEPRNWSSSMAPEGKTLVVVEFFCFQDDEIWNTKDDKLEEITVTGLEDLGFIRSPEVLWSEVVRVPGAYPLFEVGYERNVKTLMDYLEGFENLSVAGRGGSFAYLNMDHAIDAGLNAGKEALDKVRPA